MRILYLIVLISLVVTQVRANDTVKVKIPLFRQHFHDKIDEEQRLIDRSDGKIDQMLNTSNNNEVNMLNSDALFRRVDELQIWVERNEKLPASNDKIRYLRYIENALNNFRISSQAKIIKPIQFQVIFDLFEKMLSVLTANESLLSYVSTSPYDIAKLLSDIFVDNAQHAEMVKIVYQKFCYLHPDKILETITPYVDQPFADTLILIACKNNPVELYSYAQSLTSPQGKLIHQNRNPLVVGVAAISQTSNALFYYPFLDNILSGKQTIDDIKKYVGDGENGYDSIGYYKLLIKTSIEYFARMAPPLRDTPIAMLGPNGLREMLRSKSIQHFIAYINELHNQPNLSIRMNAIEPLSSEEIYYMIVMGENDIYTSSYKHSFNRMMQLMGRQPRGDSLLQNVHFDYFRKFIKMAANFNKLDTFLKTMPKVKSEVLMKAFVSNLDKSNNLEDAVDVADAYSSITDPKLLRTIYNYVKENEEKALLEENKRGAVIYGLLKTIFKSADSSSAIDLTSTLGIPSIYEVRPADLQDDSGRIVQQVFFYGDEDGNNIFQPFLNSFSSKEWTITQKNEWVEIKSLRGRGRVWVYANKPLDYDQNLDDSAQVHLANYLEENNIHPSVVVHRGHSYWLPGTISRMPSNVKIVVLGSCGGYKNLNKIIDVCPEANIISTKEIGTGEINRPILNYLNQSFLSGKYIVWKNMWSSLTNTFSHDPSKELYESWLNYIPPYRNLGAIFIKAYNKMMETE